MIYRQSSAVGRQPDKMYLSLLFILIATSSLFAQSLPEGFQNEDLSIYRRDNSGLCFDKNGRGYLWRMTGQVHILDTTGQLLPQALIDLSKEVAKWHDQGMAGFALHPDFPDEPYIYLLYVVDRHHYFYFDTPDYDPNIATTHQASIGRITRYKVDASTDYTSVLQESRLVLLGKTLEDGFPILFNSHGLGVLAFGEDGSLLATCGDGGSSISIDIGSDGNTFYRQALEDGIIQPEENIGAYRSQLLSSLAGKLIRIDPNTGEGLASNPFYDAAHPRSAQSRIWSLGLRNPFRFIVKPNSGSHFPEDGNPGVIYLGDVGYDSWEELNVIAKGGTNLGWPIYEGFAKSKEYAHLLLANPDAPNPLFNAEDCQQEFFYFQDLLNEDNEAKVIELLHPCDENALIYTVPSFLHHRPALVYRNEARDSSPIAFTPTFDEMGKASIVALESPNSTVEGKNFQGISSLAGAFYRGDNFPASYNNAYFHLDYDGWIRVFYMNESNRLIKVDTFFEGGEKLTALAVHPKDACLYYLSYPEGLHRICFGGNLPPKAVIQADKTFGSSPLEVQFDAGASFDVNVPLSYFWDFGDGESSTAIAPVHTFQNTGLKAKAVEVQLRVRDSLGASATTTQIISLDNTPPQVKIMDWQEGNLFPTDESHLMTLQAIVEDKEHTPEELTYAWETYLHHNTHFHAIQNFDTEKAYLITAPVGCNGTDYWYRIKLSVKDDAGLVGQDEVNIFPNCEEAFIRFSPLTSFATSKQIDLQWETLNEQNVQELLIERSGDGFDFEDIARLAPKGAGEAYFFEDVQPLMGINQYRIRAIAENRAWIYSNLSIAFFPPQQNVYLYPNPSNGLFQIDVLKTYATKLQLEIFKADGAKVAAFNWATTIESDFSKKLDLNHLANGVYFYHLKNGREELRQAIVIVKK